MTAGARMLRILVAIIVIAVILSSVIAAWARVEHPRTEADDNDQATAAIAARSGMPTPAWMAPRMAG